jgi:hypothetical protein
MKPFLNFYEDISKILLEAKQKVYTSINAEMVMAYWRIGKRIIEEEQSGEKRAEYGTFLVKQLSERLTKEFGKGFSVANVWNFRQFYLIFPENEILYAVRRELTWTHYRSIMRVDNPDARKYYIEEAANQNWGTRQLDRNISTFYYERLLSSKNKKEMIEKQQNMLKASPQDIIKDPYVLEFLSILARWICISECLRIYTRQKEITLRLVSSFVQKKIKHWLSIVFWTKASKFLPQSINWFFPHRKN